MVFYLDKLEEIKALVEKLGEEFSYCQNENKGEEKFWAI